MMKYELSKNDLNSSELENKKGLEVDVILTFVSPNEFGETQEFFDIFLPIDDSVNSSVSFIDKNLFVKVLEKIYQINRHPGDLFKISTASNWRQFSKLTKLQSLPDLGHSCKWSFGKSKRELDYWERSLISRFNFGMNVNECINEAVQL